MTARPRPRDPEVTVTPAPSFDDDPSERGSTRRRIEQLNRDGAEMMGRLAPGEQLALDTLRPVTGTAALPYPQVRARRQPLARWWACDNRHSITIPPTAPETGQFRTTCRVCDDDVTYYVDLGTAEDDITRRTPAP